MGQGGVLERHESATEGPKEPNDWLGEDYVTINWHHAIAETHAHYTKGSAAYFRHRFAHTA